MPGLFDIVNQPLVVLQNMFDQQGKLDSIAVSEYFSKELENTNMASQVKLLNCTPLHNLKPNCLVRYRGMVQDMFDPEFYLGAYEVEDLSTKQTFMKSGMYKDIAECKPNEIVKVDSNQNVMLDRQTLYCIPIPGETQWVKQAYSSSQSSICNSEQASTSSGQLKRAHDDDVEEMVTESSASFQTHPDSAVETENEEVKRNKSESHQASRTSSQLPDLNFPLQGETGCACLVRVYGKIDALKVNDMVEFIGVLSMQITESDSEMNAVGGDGDETSSEPKLPPPSLVPRLHAVVIYNLKHNNPHLPANINSSVREKVMQDIGEDMETLRRRLLEILQMVTLGDNLAAEYLLCHLVSSVYFSAGLLPIGKLCLNLSHIPKSGSYPRLLHSFISSLVTKSHLLPLSLHCLNSLQFCSNKNYSTNRLKSGVLQLSRNTNLILDETQLEAGQLTVEGHKNIKALEHVIRWQKVQYDFDFYQREFEADIAIICVSEGKSILPSDAHIPLEATVSHDDLLNHFHHIEAELRLNLLQKFRIYLGLAQNMEYSIDKELEALIQNDFISMRQNDRKSMSEDDLHSLLNLTRLLTMSRGLSCPTAQIWQWAKTLESSRKQRLQTPPTSQ